MLDSELAFAPATELLRLVSSGAVSPVELAELYLARAQALDPRLNAYLTLDYDGAMQAARAAEAAVLRGEALGSLHGLPVAIKDLDLTKGLRTTAGSLAFKERVPEEDSIVVERVRRAGAVIIGKTNTPEFGLLGTTENRLGGPCRNPWDPERTSGGSSGGAGAALAAGLCALATGSDGGGSIRIPASFCGVYGLKPTYGRVPRYYGARAPAIASQLSQPGPMSRTVRDAALLFQVMAGHDRRDPNSLRERPPDLLKALDGGVEGLRVAWSADYGYAAVDPEVVEVTSRAAHVFEDLGCVVEEADLALDSPYEPFSTVFSANVYAAFGVLLESQPHKLSDYAVRVLETGRAVTGAQYAKALGYIDRLRVQLTELFDRSDLLLSPTMAVPAFPIGQRPGVIGGRQVDPWWGFVPFTFPINMAGNPAASVPCGFSAEGMPIGLHVVGRLGDEAAVVAASAAFEVARPWLHHRPPVS